MGKVKKKHNPLKEQLKKEKLRNVSISGVGIDLYIKRLVESGTDINLHMRYLNKGFHNEKHHLYLPLGFACLEKNVELVKALIEHGAKVDKSDQYDSIALMDSAENDEIGEITQILIKSGADVNKQNKGGLTALHCAAGSNNLKTAQILTKNGADVNKQNQEGMTPLHFAVRGKSVEAVEILIKRGADVNKQNLEWMTPLHFATISFTTISYGTKVSERNNYVKLVKILIDNGADVNKQNLKGMTPLHFAVIGKSVKAIEAVKTLIKRGADVNKQDREGMTPLHFATISYGAKVKKRDNYIEVVKILIENGADVNKQNREGMTALHFAISGGYVEIIRILKAVEVQVGQTKIDLRKSNPFGITSPITAQIPTGKYEKVATYLQDSDATASKNETQVALALNP